MPASTCFSTAGSAIDIGVAQLNPPPGPPPDHDITRQADADQGLSAKLEAARAQLAAVRAEKEATEAAHTAADAARTAAEEAHINTDTEKAVAQSAHDIADAEVQRPIYALQWCFSYY